MKRPEFDLVKITPEMAKAWLRATPPSGNRPLRMSHASALAEQMSEGRWRTTNQGIGIMADGTVSDGQHRLHAIIIANRPVTMLVAFNQTPDDQVKVDLNRVRTLSNVISIARPNEQQVTAKAAMLRVIASLTTTDYSIFTKLDGEDAIQLLDEHRAEMDLAIAMNGKAARIPASTMAVIALMLRWNYDEGNAFGTGVVKGADLRDGAPQLVLRNWLAVRHKTTPIELITVKSIVAADAFIRGETLTKLPTSAERRYPRFAKKLGLPINTTIASMAERGAAS
jgi:hypothetical protein